MPIEKSRLLLALLLACLEAGSMCYGFRVETCASGRRRVGCIGCCRNPTSTLAEVGEDD